VLVQTTVAAPASIEPPLATTRRFPGRRARSAAARSGYRRSPT
jgi:hypothetical protein